MRTFTRICLLFVLGCLARPDAAAQESSSQAAAAAYLESNVRELVATSDTLTQFRTELRPDGRYDLDEKILRAEYGISARPAPNPEPEAAARQYLKVSEEKFGILRPDEELEVVSVRHGHQSTHVTLQQTYRGIPVYNREVKVNLDSEGRPTMVLNGFAPHASTSAELSTTPAITREEAARRVMEAGREDLETTTPELVVYPAKPLRLGWRMTAWPKSAAVEWEVLVDARTGEIIQMLDVTFHAHRPASPGRFDRRPTPTSSNARSGRAREFAPAGVAMADGVGLVFDPDPISSAGVPYGPPFVDGDDADIPELNAERKQVTLRDITQGSDGLYRLEGPYVVIDDGSRGIAYTPPAEVSPDAFQYTRANDYFEAVNAYYHVDKSQRYVQSLDVGFDIKNEPVLVNPHGFFTDDSQYQPGGNIILLGSGGIDDAEDADVIWHEYAHVLLDFSAPGIINTGEGSALHEGWGDYWAASYSRYLSEEVPGIPPHDWRHIFSWDGNMPCWQGRPLDHPGHYPDQVSYPASGCASFGGPIYEEGMLWATTLMEIYPLIGRNVLDRLNLASHAYIASGVTFADAAHAIIQADEDLYGGEHAGAIIERFGARGYVDPSDFGPVLTHDRLEATEQLGGSVPIAVSATATTADVDTVIVFFSVETTPFDHLVLVEEGNETYTGELPLPDEPGRIRYYIEAVDEAGRRRRLPSGAPVETYAFDVGPDHVAPIITHEPPHNVSVVGWPMDVYVEASDNLGVDSVWVEYEIQDVAGQAVIGGTFGLEATGAAFFGRFPTTTHKVKEGESASYRIFARDEASSGNVSVIPTEGSFHVSIIEEGVLRSYDMEHLTQGLQGDGAWQRGMPKFGLRVAHSGDHVWSTGVEGPYPDTPQRSSLLMPPLNLDEIDSAYLVFWHWYDFEHDGAAQPGTFDQDAGIWDGGNLKVSVDGGDTWSTLQPEGGYSGTIDDQSDNSMGGEPGFGGFSYGWRQEVVQLPEAPEVRVRFDFGTDAGNSDRSLFFAGWFIDDILITTIYPEDEGPPSISILPDQRSVRIPGQEDTPQISVTVDDDTGVEAVVSEYTISKGGAEESGTTRFSMAETDVRVYSGGVVPPQSFAPGDRIEYRLRVRDFAGNEAVYPGPDDVFVVDFRAAQRTNALSDVVSTGAWHVQGGTWVTSGAGAAPSVSSLLLEPFVLPSNSETAALIIEHRYQLSEESGGNLKISLDDGATWTLVTPDGGYPQSYQGSGHSMEGEGIFSGTSDGTETSIFGLSPYTGEQIRLRFDFVNEEDVPSEQGWYVHAATYEALSPDEEFQTPFELELHANFPDPFADQTTISYSISDRTPVRLSVYDILGRRVALIRHVVQDEGIYSVQFDGSSLSSGVYMLHLETTQGNRTERMIIVR